MSRFRTRNLDPYWLTARFNSKCSNPKCGREIKKGERAFYFPNGKSIRCDRDECGGQASRDFEAAKADESGCCF